MQSGRQWPYREQQRPGCNRPAPKCCQMNSVYISTLIQRPAAACRPAGPAAAGCLLLTRPRRRPGEFPHPRPQISQLAMQLRDLPSMPTTGRCGTLGSHAPYHAPAPHSNGAWSPQNGCSAPPGAPGARACRRRTRLAYQRSWVRIGYPLSGRAERCTLQYRPRVRASFLAMSSSRGCGGMLALCSASSTSTICRLRQQGAPTGVRRVPPWRRDR